MREIDYIDIDDEEYIANTFSRLRVSGRQWKPHQLTV